MSEEDNALRLRIRNKNSRKDGREAGWVEGILLALREGRKLRLVHDEDCRIELAGPE